MSWLRTSTTIPDSDPLLHRDPNEIFRDPNAQSQGPHCEDAGMVSMTTEDPEIRFERAVDRLDTRLMKGEIHQEEYDAEYAALKQSIFPKEADAEFPGGQCKGCGKDLPMVWGETFCKECVDKGIASEHGKKLDAALKRKAAYFAKDQNKKLGASGDTMKGPDGDWWIETKDGTIVRMQRAQDAPAAAVSTVTTATPPVPVTNQEEDPNMIWNEETFSFMPKEQKPVPAAPKDTNPEDNPMVHRKIELHKELQIINDEVAQLSKTLEAKVAELRKTVKEEDPQLKELLKSCKDMKVTVGGWIVWLYETEDRWTPKYEKILAKVSELVKDTNPALHALIETMKEPTKNPTEYGGDTTPETTVKVKNTPQRSDKKSWLDTLAEPEVIVTADVKEWWAQFKDWLKQTFVPEFNQVKSNIDEMKSLLAEVK